MAEHRDGHRNKQGFVLMDPKRQHEIASKGAQAVKEKGIAHHFTSEEVHEAGHKSGEATQGKRHH
jgi:general stress protein YciG